MHELRLNKIHQKFVSERFLSIDFERLSYTQNKTFKIVLEHIQVSSDYRLSCHISHVQNVCLSLPESAQYV
jgi:hypothetical protein